MNRIAFISLFAVSFSFGQEVKFKNTQLENGLLYPTVIFKDQTEAQEKMNDFLSKQVQMYAQQDMCIGQFGYVQKGNYIQISQYVNCMEMTSSMNHRLLFDLKTGESIPVSDMVDPNRRADFEAYMTGKITEHLKKKAIEITPELEQKIKETSIDEFDVLFADHGITLTSTDFPNWSGSKLTLSWNDLQRFLKVRLV